MTPNDIDLVTRSFALVSRIAPQAAEIFYEKLFAADPSLRPMFRGDMTAQGRRLMTMLATAVRLLGDPDTLMPTLRILGARHVAYGVQDAHYDTVGQALIQTLQAGLGDAFTPPVRFAWLSVYAVISSTMKAAADDAVVVD